MSTSLYCMPRSTTLRAGLYPCGLAMAMSIFTFEPPTIREFATYTYIYL